MPRAQDRRIATVDHHPPVEQDDLIADPTGEVKVLRREQHPGTRRSDRRESLAENHYRLGVERGGRLVDEEEWGAQRESGDSADLSAKSAGERAERLVESIREPESCGENPRTFRGPRTSAPQRPR